MYKYLAGLNSCTLPWQPLFPTLIALKGGHIQGSLLYQCTLNQLKVSLGGGLKSSAWPRTLNFPHPNCPLIITKREVVSALVQECTLLIHFNILTNVWSHLYSWVYI